MNLGGKSLFKVLGLPELDEACRDTANELMEAEQPSAMAAAEPIKEKWVELVPVLDGNYRRSLTITWLGKVGAGIGTAWLNDLPRNEQPFLYAKPLEFGNSHQGAEPSARPAIAASKQQAIAAGEEPLRSVIRGRSRRRRTHLT